MYDRDDPTFVQDLLRSDVHVDLIARWLFGSGYDPVVPPLRVRDAPENMRQYADAGDIFVGNHRIECKQRGLRFTGLSDFPYPTIIVDAAHCWDNADTKPFCYMLTDKKIESCVVVRASTYPFWCKTNKYDAAKHRHRAFYECPIGRCEIYHMGDETIRLWPTG